MEQWKQAIYKEQLFDHYEVSDQGNVRSLDRISSDGRRCKGKLLKLATQNQYGHLVVTLRKDDQSYPCGVHRLVLEAFIGPCPPNMECCHANGDPSDNRPINLRWGTRLDNMRDKRLHGTQCKGSSHGQSKLTEDQVKEIRLRHKAGAESNSKALAKEYDVAYCTINDIVRRKFWKHI